MLEAATANLVSQLKATQELNLADAAFTLQVGRTAFSHRRMVVCRDSAEAIQALVKEISAVPMDGLPELGGYSRATANALKGHAFDRKALGAGGLKYERLDQLTIEVILGVR